MDPVRTSTSTAGTAVSVPPAAEAPRFETTSELFPGSVRALESDSFAWTVALLLATLLALGGGIYWVFAARVPLVVESSAAHVEAAPVEGRRTVGTLVAGGALTVIASFSAADTVGRMKPGQRASMRLDGFPWTRFGTIPLTVVAVGGDPDRGRTRVELAPSRDAVAPSIPLQHGMTGTVEVELERLSPAQLLLQSIAPAPGLRSGDAR
jgi:adhesin transport system membrane fusion protein